MASHRMRLVRAFLRSILRPLNRGVRGPGLLRAGFAAMAALTPGAGVAVTATPAIWWFTPPDAANEGPVILYLHGGAYVAGQPGHYRAMLGRLALWSGCRVAAPVLRLAPEHPAPAAFDDTIAAHALLLAGAVPAGRIVLGGDSAGGGLALALLARLCASDLRPAGLFAFSPWTDLALTGKSLIDNAATDALIPAARMAEVVELVRGDLAAIDPRLSPLYAAFAAPPPCLLLVAADEVLRDDTRRMADRLRQTGGRVDVEEAEGVFHAWPFAAGRLPESDTALHRTADFVRSVLRPSSPSAGS